MSALDPRLTLRLDGLAAAALEGIVQADHYGAATPMTVRVPAAAVRSRPGPEESQENQLLYGEGFDVLVERRGWCFGQVRRDGYVGWVEPSALGPAARPPTHRVRTTVAALRAGPSGDAAAPLEISLNALVAVDAVEGGYAREAGGMWIAQERLAPLGVYDSDPAAAALGFLGARYVWGGREAAGLDCSGLVQQALFACGRACPRDSDQQQAALGVEIAAGESYEGLARNDLVFWGGHVGLMIDEARLIHASGTDCAVVVEDLAEAIDRIRPRRGDPTAFRRLGPV